MEQTKDTSRKQKRASPFTYVEKELFESKAWLSLLGIAPQVYTIFLLKRVVVKIDRKKGHDRKECINSRELQFSYKEAQEKYGITHQRFVRAIDELVEKGFIDIVRSSSGMFKKTTLYGLSDRWRKYGTPQFERISRPKGNHIGFRANNWKKQMQQEETS